MYKDYVPASLRGVVAWAAERVEKMAATSFTGIIGATPLIADRLRQANSNTIVVHNFPILEEMMTGREQAWKQRAPAIAYLGSISRERGIFEMVEAMNLLRPSANCRLALAGWFSPPTLQAAVERLPGASRVDCLGRLSRTQITELLGQVQAGIAVLHSIPNYMNAKPTKVFEYMCAGIPVIASNFPLWREIVENAKCGLLVDPGHPRLIAEAIEYLCTHPEEAEEMGRNGRIAASRLFSWKSEERALLALYRSIFVHQNPGHPTHLNQIDCSSQQF
jgi:glycosyltransferase involved in cell wall biosynthesis